MSVDFAIQTSAPYFTTSKVQEEETREHLMVEAIPDVGCTQENACTYCGICQEERVIG